MNRTARLMMQRSVCLHRNSHFLFPIGLADLFVLTQPPVPGVPFALLSRKVTTFTVTWRYIKVPSVNLPAHNNKSSPDVNGLIVPLYRGIPVFFCVLSLSNKRRHSDTFARNKNCGRLETCHKDTCFCVCLPREYNTAPQTAKSQSQDYVKHVLDMSPFRRKEAEGRIKGFS